MKNVIIIAVVIGLALLQSCGDDDASCTKVVPAETVAPVDKTRLAADIITIDNYLNSNGITAQSEPNGVRYVITSSGTGPTPCLENRISAKYTGKLLNGGNVFDSSTTGVSFILNRLILGWQLVLPVIPAGSKITLYIPSGFGYGEAGGANGKIPSNANLIFEIEFVAIL
jgi:FKBP-type peptidyl-prolyl cis-trans isomerase FkpA